MIEASDLALLFMRIVIGAIFLVHGLSKRSFWKKAEEGKPAGSMGNIMKALSIFEPLGGAAIILGLLTPIAALGLSVIILGAIYFKINQWKMRFWMMDNTGWEFDLMILSGLTVLMAAGAGALSIDVLLSF